MNTSPRKNLPEPVFRNLRLSLRNPSVASQARLVIYVMLGYQPGPGIDLAQRLRSILHYWACLVECALSSPNQNEKCCPPFRICATTGAPAGHIAFTKLWAFSKKRSALQRSITTF